ncbi:hepatocyte growth factor-like isoform X1 [Paramormyrops kingsleyae]|uniref:Hepatocyte growth factor n=2 Tax=Paramormyrops kingsleyae TaxID=1676925 RepID=A0A3B3QMB5_9TELE|nr:hepatocyte growth factor-like isoform X1 [Paramormyrops kingsleyae]
MDATVMWMYTALIWVTLIDFSESKRHSLQDYQKRDGVRLIRPDRTFPTKSRSLSVVKCARSCSSSKRMPFTCRAFYFDQRNRKCHWLSFDSYTAGIQTDHNLNYDLYEKKDYVKQCITGTGLNYRGTISVTKTKIKCQAWASTMPHDHNFLPARSKKEDLRENHCRNPDNETTGPWCFTTNPQIRHQSCAIPQCSEVECVTCNGENYRGPVDHTESGKECQRWNLMEPHRHPFHPKRYPDKGLNDNYCRNPDSRLRPWCYTLDPKTPWEYCNIKPCEPDAKADSDTTTTCFRGRGEMYHGTVGVTPSGVKCQRWDSQFPHNHSYSPQNYKCKDLRENFCRNPDGNDLPWCFTTDPKVRKAFCTNIPRCGTETAETEDCYEDNGHKYRGHLSKTRSGIHCAPWDDHSRSWERNSTVLAAGLEMNFCRNPDNDKHGPWCYTNDSSVPWDYCMIKPCKLPPSPGKQKSDVSNVSCFVHIKTRIIGGDQVKIKEGSWMVSIQKGNSHWCGGSLIREDWVLTDRQCFSSCVPDLTEYSVRMGFVNLNTWDRNVSRKQELKISHVICGPEGSNLAMLKLSQPAFQSEYVRRIELPVAGCTMKEGTNCTVFGWGETKGTGHEGVLKAVQLPIVSNEKCHWYHRGNLPITETKICAGGIKDKGVCERDYGGPLVCQEGGSKVILGVSIHGRGCARANRPAVFVNVPYYTQWIHKVFRYYSNLENNY